MFRHIKSKLLHFILEHEEKYRPVIEPSDGTSITGQEALESQQEPVTHESQSLAGVGTPHSQVQINPKETIVDPRASQSKPIQKPNQGIPGINYPYPRPPAKPRN